jgi:ADP-ribosylation factor-like protein 8
VPTVAFNKKELKKGHVSIKCWDLGGQPKFRSMWERYCRDVNAIIFVVDAADRDALPVARDELLDLLEGHHGQGHGDGDGEGNGEGVGPAQGAARKEALKGIPLLVLANKSDLEGKMGVDEVIEGLELKRVREREVSCYGVSAKEETNLEAVLQVSFFPSRGCVSFW